MYDLLRRSGYAIPLCIFVFFFFYMLFSRGGRRADMMCGIECGSDQLDWFGVVFLVDWGAGMILYFFFPLLPIILGSGSMAEM